MRELNVDVGFKTKKMSRKDTDVAFGRLKG
jgi:hypothetical protein